MTLPDAFRLRRQPDTDTFTHEDEEAALEEAEMVFGLTWVRHASYPQRIAALKAIGLLPRKTIA